MVTVISLKDGVHLGDDDNALSIANALIPKLSDKKTKVEPLALEDLASKKFAANEEYIVVGAGAQSVAALAQLGKQANITAIWSGHQTCSELNANALKNIDQIILPEYAINNAMKTIGDKLVVCPYGVPNSKNATQLRDEYLLKENIKYKTGDCIAVVLGGDAVDSSGKISHFTKEEANELGKYAGMIAKHYDIPVIATNCPRTGLYEGDQKIDGLHQEGAKLDIVSQSFIDGLQQAGVSDYEFHDFKAGKPSALNAIMGKIIADNSGKSFAFVAGDSGSMVSEATENLPVGSLIIYKTSAMSNSHNKQVEQLNKSGYAHIYDIEASSLNKLEQYAPSPPEHACDIAAKQIIAKIEQSKNTQIKIPSAIIAM